MKQIIYILLPTLFIFTSCGKNYEPNSYYPNSEDGIEAFFPDSIGIWDADINLDWINDTSKSITAIYGDTDIMYQVILLDYNNAGKKITKHKILPKLRGFRLKKNKYGFKYIAENKKETILIWQDSDYLYQVRFKKKNKQIAVDSCYFLDFK